MTTRRPHSLALALPLLFGLMCFAPVFLGDQPFSYVLGIDHIVEEGISWGSPLGGVLQALLDFFAYLNPAGLRLTGLLCIFGAAVCLVFEHARQGDHPVAGGLTAAMLIAHPATLAAVMKLDNTGLALALLLIATAVTLWHRLSRPLRALVLIAPALAHPIGICTWPMIWLFQRDATERSDLRHPIYLGSLLVPAAIWIALTPTQLNQLLALAGQTWLNVFSGWRMGEYLPWAPEIAQARLNLPGVSSVLVALFFCFTGAIVLLERFGNVLSESAHRLLPLAVIAPLLTGLTPIVDPVHGDPAFALPLVLGLAVLIAQGAAALVQRSLQEENLTGAVLQTAVVVAATVGVFFITSKDQVAMFRDGQIFWQVQRSRHDAAPQSRLGYARAVLFWATDPRLKEQGNVDIMPAIKAAQILDNLFESLDEGSGLTAAQEAEAHWLFSVALTPHFVNDMTPAIEHLKKAVSLQPNKSFYAEELDRTQKFYESYQSRLLSCQTVNAAKRDKYRMILMKQAEVLAKAGLIESTIRKYHDALRCDPNHRDGYHYLSRALTSVGKYDEAVALLGRRPEPLKNDVGLMEQSAFIVQNRPSPKGADAKAQIAWRSQQRAVAKTMWLEIARRAPKRLMAWLNLAESALIDGSGPGRAKAYFNQALKHHPNMTRKARVRQLKDRIDRAIKPDTTIPAIELKPPTAVDAGPNQDGGPP